MTTSHLLLPRGTPSLRPWHAVLVSAAVVVLWAAWAAAFNAGQFGDNVEQFNWAQSLEAGYHKHPPLPSWLLGVVVRLFGPSIYWAYALATLCLLGTLAFTWLVGRELLGERIAAAAVVLWGLNLSFSLRVQLYNHNTLLVLCMAGTVWCAMRATRGRAIWWAATGLGAGAALLSKYQAAVPLAGLLLALVWAGHLKRPAQWRGLGLALVVMLAVFAPHAVWVVRHDFSTLRYASDAIESSSLRDRLGFIVSFVANQLRLMFPALIAMVLCWVWACVAPVKTLATPTDEPVLVLHIRVWMVGLIWGALGVLAVMALAGGVSLRNHWGVQALQFIPLWFVWRWERRTPIDLRRLLWAALIVHGASLAFYAAEHRDPHEVLSSRRNDTMYPAAAMARAGVAHWVASTRCPLAYVAGTAFDAGLVSLYAGGRIKVYDSAQATPWVSPEDLRRAGALYVLDERDAVPAEVTNVVAFDLAPGDLRGRAPKIIRLGVLMPQPPCA